MDKAVLSEGYIRLLKKEVVPALGCTEPIAVAYASAISTELLGGVPDLVELTLSVNIIKNALGVGIPGTDKTGVAIAAALGAICKNSEKGLQLLVDITKEQEKAAQQLVEEGRINIKVSDSLEKLYIDVFCKRGEDSSRVIIEREHTRVIYKELNQRVLWKEDKKEEVEHKEETTLELSVANIYDFALSVPYEDISFLLEGAYMNQRVSQEGLNKPYGLMVGEKIFNSFEYNVFGNNLMNKIVAETAAASDARMSGCQLPIMTTAGSGNQGIACTLPPAVLARELRKNEEELARALALSSLITIYIKSYMGRLSPICGAGIAASTGASVAMTYLMGGKLHNINCAINNMLSDVAGIICDGAKSTCALKIATSVNAAIQCSTLAMSEIQPAKTDGIVCENADKTIRNIENLISKGYENTDRAILEIMLNK